jgi:hypothetical protein
MQPAFHHGLLRRAIALGFLLLCCRVGAPAEAQQALEQDVKAAFLYNFTKYVDWPSSAFRNDADPFRMCVMADRAQTDAVQAIIAGEIARGRPLQLVRPSLADVPRCHILFIGRSESRQAAALAAAAPHPVLTVGEAPSFLDDGGAVLFVIEQGRIRFDISLRATGKARLNVSSKLLRVARRVKDGTA